MAIKSFYIKESQLDIQQRRIVNKKLAQNLVVTGGAGSGKSVLALWKAKAIQDIGSSVLYVVKTVALTKFMSDGVSSVDLKSSSISSYNHCFNWTKDEYDQWQNKGWKYGSFDYIILDEATDLDINEVNVLIQHCKYFIAFGDNDQQLYEFIGVNTKVNNIAQSVNVTNIDYLIYNHRLPKKVARLVVYAHPSISHQSEEETNFINRCTNEGTELPQIYYSQNKESQYDTIIKIIKNKDGGLKDVGILFRDKETLREAYDYFATHDMPSSLVLDSKFEGEPFNSDAPKLMTFHGSKGLQFETVFLPNCSEDSKSAPFYVALTRTYSSLYIMYTGVFPNIFSNVDLSLYETNNVSNDKSFDFQHSSATVTPSIDISDGDDLPF